MELSLSVVIHHPHVELDLKTQIEVMQQAHELAIEKFRENGELALDTILDILDEMDK